MDIKEFLGKAKKHLGGYLWMLIGCGCRIKSDQVLFFTFQGQYTCNPRYVCEALRKQNPQLRCIWVLFEDNDGKDIPEGIKTVRMGTADYFKALYTSKVWVDNAFNVVKLPVRKKKGQFLVETMHGSLGIKKIGPDSNRTKKRNRNAFKSSAMTDFIISNSEFEDMVYRTSFWEHTPIQKLGHARNDILVRSAQDQAFANQCRTEIRAFYHLNDEVQIALYGPTYLTRKREDAEELNLVALKSSLEARFGGKWVILNRMHLRDARRQENSSYADGVLDGNLYRDIQTLMTAIDFAVTDYSSWIFDYVLTRKPGLLYVPDLTYYGSTTGLYYPIMETPYPVATSNAEAAQLVTSYMEQAELEQKVEAFLKNKGCVDDGHAAEYAAQRILAL